MNRKHKSSIRNEPSQSPQRWTGPITLTKPVYFRGERQDLLCSVQGVSGNILMYGVITDSDLAGKLVIFPAGTTLLVSGMKRTESPDIRIDFVALQRDFASEAKIQENYARIADDTHAAAETLHSITETVHELNADIRAARTTDEALATTAPKPERRGGLFRKSPKG